MRLKETIAALSDRWRPLTFYQRFEDVVIVALTGLIAVVIVMALWSLAVKIILGVLPSGLDFTDYAVFQAIFGMIFTVIIALEFRRSLVILHDRHNSIVQVRTVVLIALLAVVRKLMIVDIATTDAAQLFALAAAILALGGVHWLVREQDRRASDDAVAGAMR